MMNDMEFAGVVLCPVSGVRWHSVEFRSHSIHRKWSHDNWRRHHDAMLRFRETHVIALEDGEDLPTAGA
jgi:hypothetical protein